MLEIDCSSSYGIVNVRFSPLFINAAEIIWNGKTGANLLFRCNCTSTAFAPHKHGGEKGIHMRLQIDTYELSGGGSYCRQPPPQPPQPPKSGCFANQTANMNQSDFNGGGGQVSPISSATSLSLLSPPNSSSPNSSSQSKFAKDDLDSCSNDFNYYVSAMIL